ncbi:hypothetical protein BC828DRAFT_399844 [Blastocladiella britannica]|nr:hypothetical protein BC828DRAFT_399844 [Blastocladiella britannica]
MARLSHLVHLDLSSNALTTLPTAALVPLVSLRSLNVANNALTTVAGIEALPSLRRLVAAFNRITTIVALVHLHAGAVRCPLESLDLRSNAIADPGEMYYLSGLVNLKRLALHGNPITSGGSTHSVWDMCPGLLFLDGVDRRGVPAGVGDNEHDSAALLPPPPPLLVTNFGHTLLPPPTVPAVAVTAPAAEGASTPVIQHPVPPPPPPPAVVPAPAAVPASSDAANVTLLNATVARLAAALAARQDTVVASEAPSQLRDELADLKRQMADLERAARTEPPPPPPAVAPPPQTPPHRNREQTEQTIAALEAESAHIRRAAASRERKLQAALDAANHERKRSAALETRCLKLAKRAAATADELEVARADVAGLREQLGERTATVAQQEQELVSGAQEMRRVVGRLGKERDKCHAKLIEAKEEISILRAVSKELSQDLQYMKDQVREQELACKEQLREALEKHNADRANARDRLSIDHAAHVTHLQAQISDLQAQLQRERAESVQLAATAAQHTRAVESDLESAVRREKDLESQLADAHAAAADARTKAELFARERMQLGVMVKELQGKHAQVSASFTDLQQLFDHRTQKYATKLRSVTGALKVAQQQAQDQLTKLETKSAALTAATATVLDLKATVAEQSARIDGLGRDVTRLSADLATAQHAGAVKDRQVVDCQESLRNLKANLAAKVSEFTAMKDRIDAARELEAEYKLMERELVHREDLIDEYRRERDEHRAECTRVRSKLADRDEALSRIEAEAASMRAAMAAHADRADHELRSQVGARDLAIDELKRLLQATQDRFAAVEADRDRFSAQCARAEHELQDARRDACKAAETHQHEVAGMRQQNDALRAKWDALSKLLSSSSAAMGP